METKVNYAAVGLFVVALGAAFVAGVLWLGTGAFQKKYDLYLALVDESVSGLNLSAPVKYSGVEVGRVRDMQLEPNNPVRVRLTFAIERGTSIKEDTVAVLKTQGLTGIAYVELTGGSRDSPQLRATTPGEYPVIRTKPSLSARLENMLTTVLAKLDGTSTSINALLSEENRAAFKSALADISAVTRTLAARRETLDAGIASAARTFENGARVTAQFGPVIDRMGPVIDRMGRSADAIEKMANEAERTSAGAGKTVDAVGADVKRFTAETLPELERLLGEMSVLATSLRRLSARIEGSPGGLLLGRRQVPPGPGE